MPGPFAVIQQRADAMIAEAVRGIDLSRYVHGTDREGAAHLLAAHAGEPGHSLAVEQLAAALGDVCTMCDLCMVCADAPDGVGCSNYRQIED